MPFPTRPWDWSQTWAHVIRATARSGRVLRAAAFAAALVLAAALVPSAAHAIAAPDSAGLARFTKAAGRSGHAKLRVLWRGEWHTLRDAEYDREGVYAGLRERDTGGMTAVWAQPSPPDDIPWGDIERLQVPSGRRGPAGPLVGAAAGAIMSLTAISIASTAPGFDPMDTLALTGSFVAAGAVAGTVFSALNPFRKPIWIEF